MTDRGTWRVATWNVLAEALCDPDRFADVDPAALHPGRRRAGVVAEVVRWVAAVDVVCLQEVDDALCAALEEAGLWVEVAVHDDGVHGVAVVAAAALPTESGALGGGRRWVAATLADRDGEGHGPLVLSCHLQHPGDAPVGSAQAATLADHLGAHLASPGDRQAGDRQAGDRQVAVGADVNAAVGGPATDPLVAIGLELHQPSPTAWIRGGPRTTDVLALPAGGRLTTVAGPTGPLPTTDWPSDHRLVAGEWPRR